MVRIVGELLLEPRALAWVIAFLKSFDIFVVLQLNGDGQPAVDTVEKTGLCMDVAYRCGMDVDNKLWVLNCKQLTRTATLQDSFNLAEIIVRGRLKLYNCLLTDADEGASWRAQNKDDQHRIDDVGSTAAQNFFFTRLDQATGATVNEVANQIHHGSVPFHVWGRSIYGAFFYRQHCRSSDLPVNRIPWLVVIGPTTHTSGGTVYTGATVHVPFGRKNALFARCFPAAPLSDTNDAWYVNVSFDELRHTLTVLAHEGLPTPGVVLYNGSTHFNVLARPSASFSSAVREAAAASAAAAVAAAASAAAAAAAPVPASAASAAGSSRAGEAAAAAAAAAAQAGVLAAAARAGLAQLEDDLEGTRPLQQFTQLSGGRVPTVPTARLPPQQLDASHVTGYAPHAPPKGCLVCLPEWAPLSDLVKKNIAAWHKQQQQTGAPARRGRKPEAERFASGAYAKGTLNVAQLLGVAAPLVQPRCTDALHKPCCHGLQGRCDVFRLPGAAAAAPGPGPLVVLGAASRPPAAAKPPFLREKLVGGRARGATAGARGGADEKGEVELDEGDEDEKDPGSGCSPPQAAFNNACKAAFESSNGRTWHFQPPDPYSSSSLTDNDALGAFCVRELFMWDPWVTFEHLLGTKKPCCPRCNKADNVSRDGWRPQGARRVVDVDGCIYVWARRFRCEGCEAKEDGDVTCFLSYNLTVQQALSAAGHAWLASVLPVVFTHKLAVTTKVLTMARFALGNGISAEKLGALLADLAMEQYTRSRIGCGSALLALKRQGQTTLSPTGGIQQPGATKGRFSEFDDKSGYCGKLLQPSYLRALMLMDFRRREKFLLTRLMMYVPRILRGDMTFKTIKKVIVDNFRPYTCTFSLMGEKNHILAFATCRSKSLDEVKTVLQRVGGRNKFWSDFGAKVEAAAATRAGQHAGDGTGSGGDDEQSGGSSDVSVGRAAVLWGFLAWCRRVANQEVERYYTDGCCPERHMLETIIPSLRKGVTELPAPEPPPGLLKMPNAMIEVVRTIDEVIIACSTLQKCKVIGLDCEWRAPVGKGGTRGRVATIQLATPDNLVFVFQLRKLAKSGKLPDALAALLRDANVLKVGLNIEGDITHLRKDYGLELPQHSPGVEDVRVAARRKLPGDPYVQQGGLQQVLWRVTGHYLPKDVADTLSDWEEADLSQSQLQYAAYDAIAPVLVHIALSTDTVRDLPIDGPGSVLPKDIVDAKIERLLASEFVAQGASVDTAVRLARVCLDIEHIFLRVEKGVNTKLGPEFALLMSMLRQAIFINVKEDEEGARKWLRIARNLNEEQLKRVSPRWFLRHVRRVVPPPEQLAARIAGVYHQFKDIEFSKKENGVVVSRPLFNIKMPGIMRNLLQHVLKGCVSDPPGMPMYYDTNTNKHGLPRYKCFRGDSNLEGMHVHLRQVLSGNNNSPEMVTAAVATFISLWNLRADTNNMGLPNYRLTAMELVDIVKAIELELYGVDSYPDWLATPVVPDADLEPFGCSNPIEDSSLPDGARIGGSEQMDTTAAVEALAEGRRRAPLVPVRDVPGGVRDCGELLVDARVRVMFTAPHHEDDDEPLEHYFSGTVTQYCGTNDSGCGIYTVVFTDGEEAEYPFDELDFDAVPAVAAYADEGLPSGGDGDSDDDFGEHDAADMLLSFEPPSPEEALRQLKERQAARRVQHSVGTARPTAAEFLQQKQGVLAPFGPVQTQEELQLFTGLLTEQLQRGGALDWDNLTLKFNEVVTERIKGGDATAKELRLKSVNACMAMYDKMNDQAQLRDMMQPHLEQFKALRSALKADDSVAHSAPAALPAPKRMRQEASAPGPPAGAAVAPSLHVALPPHGPQLPGLPPPQRQQSLAEEIAGAPGKAVRTIVLEQIVTRMYGSKEKTAGQTSAIVDAFNTAVIDAGRQDCKVDYAYVEQRLRRWRAGDQNTRKRRSAGT